MRTGRKIIAIAEISIILAALVGVCKNSTNSVDFTSLPLHCSRIHIHKEIDSFTISPSNLKAEDYMIPDTSFTFIKDLSSAEYTAADTNNAVVTEDKSIAKLEENTLLTCFYAGYLSSKLENRKCTGQSDILFKNSKRIFIAPYNICQRNILINRVKEAEELENSSEYQQRARCVFQFFKKALNIMICNAYAELDTDIFHYTMNKEHLDSQNLENIGMKDTIAYKLLDSSNSRYKNIVYLKEEIRKEKEIIRNSNVNDYVPYIIEYSRKNRYSSSEMPYNYHNDPESSYVFNTIIRNYMPDIYKNRSFSEWVIQKIEGLHIKPIYFLYLNLGLAFIYIDSLKAYKEKWMNPAFLVLENTAKYSLSNEKPKACIIYMEEKSEKLYRKEILFNTATLKDFRNAETSDDMEKIEGKKEEIVLAGKKGNIYRFTNVEVKDFSAK